MSHHFLVVSAENFRVLFGTQALGHFLVSKIKELVLQKESGEGYT
jgi:hypothetical protein